MVATPAGRWRRALRGESWFSKCAFIVALPHRAQDAAPARAARYAAARLPRPVNGDGAAEQVRARHEAPEARVGRQLAVVAEHEPARGRHRHWPEGVARAVEGSDEPRLGIGRGGAVMRVAALVERPVVDEQLATAEQHRLAPRAEEPPGG